MKSLRFIALVALVAWNGSVWADRVTPTPSNTSKRGLVSLDFHDIELQDVVKSIAEITGRNFILDDRVKGKITIISPAPVTIEEAYQAFLSALEVKNLAVVEVGKHAKIVPLRDAKMGPVPVETEQDHSYGDQVITRLIPLAYIGVSEIRQALSPLVSRTGTIVAYGPTNSLIVTDSASNIQRLVTIIEKLDKKGYQSSMEVVPLRYSQADDIANKLSMIFDSEKKSSTRRRRSDDIEGGEAISRIIPDNRTNSLIVMATKEGLGRILDLVGQLDQKVDLSPDRSRVHVRYLKHANSEDLAGILSNLFGISSSVTKPAAKKETSASNRGFTSAPPLPWEEKGSSESGEPSGAKSASTTNSSGSGLSSIFESDVRVVAETAINALIVTPSPNHYQWIGSVIDQLDVRRAQVLVETLIMEVNLQKDLEVGLSGHGGMANQNGAAFGQMSLNKLTPLGVLGLDSAAKLASPGLVLGGLSRSEFKIPGTKITIPAQGALFKALQSNGSINILSAPNILTTDNKKAEIMVGRDVPFVTSQYTGADGKPATSLSRQKVGIQLSVTPQINEGDEVTLDIEQKIQEVEEVKMYSDISTSERMAKTTVVAQSGQTVAVGGLIKDKEAKSVTKVPLLGDIPVIGNLFRSTTVSKEKINLIIFLTPHVIHDPADMTRISVKKNNERRMFNKKQGIGENQALYDYDLDRGLNMAPPAASSKVQEKPKKKFDFDQLEREEQRKSSSEDELVRRYERRGSSRSSETVRSESFEEEEEDLPRPRSRVKRTSGSGNPFADVRPPSSN